MRDVIDAIRACPRFRTTVCEGCGAAIHSHALQMYAPCPGCGAHYKCRGLGEIGSQVEDVIDAVLEWAGVTQDEVRRRHEAPGEASAEPGA